MFSGLYPEIEQNAVINWREEADLLWTGSNAGSMHCVKSVQIRSNFWSVFSRIRIEYGEIREVSLRIQSACG